MRAGMASGLRSAWASALRRHGQPCDKKGNGESRNRRCQAILPANVGDAGCYRRRPPHD